MHDMFGRHVTFKIWHKRWAKLSPHNPMRGEASVHHLNSGYSGIYNLKKVIQDLKATNCFDAWKHED